MRRTSLIILGSLLAAVTARADTYMRVEKDGTKTYSDRPLPGGQRVDIQPAQTYSAPATRPLTSSSTPAEQREIAEAANFQYQCALSPRNEETLQNPETVTVSVSLTPGLRASDTVRLAMDGAELSAGGNQSSVAPYPDRGTHTASVRVTDAFGKTLCDQSSTFHVARSNLNSPNRRPTVSPRPRPAPRSP